MPDDTNLDFSQYSVLMGKVEELSKKIDKLDQRVNGAIGDHEERLRALESHSMAITVFGDHELRLRALESRFIMAVSFGFAHYCSVFTLLGDG